MSASLPEVARDLVMALITSKSINVPNNINDPKVAGEFVGRMYRHVLREVYAGHDTPRDEIANGG